MRFKLQLNECPRVAFKYRYRLRMGGAVSMARLFNDDIDNKIKFYWYFILFL
jgi:hypothetical protein